MIKTDPKPHKKIDFYYGVIILDREYKFEVTKHTNGETKYKVESIEPKVEGQAYEIVEGSILGHCQREGLGQIENK
jgi:hypothetical protein